MLGHIRALMSYGCPDQLSVYPVGNQSCVKEMPEGVERQTFCSPINPVCLKDLVKTHADELEVNGLCSVEAKDELVCPSVGGKALQKVSHFRNKGGLHGSLRSW